MGLFTPTHGMYMAMLALYILSWLVLLAGLSAVQHTCRDNIDSFVQYESNSLLANSVGEHCHRLFRFPWFVVWLCTLPLLLEAGALMAMLTKRHHNRNSTVGKAAALFAVIATLCILLANTFYNLLESSGLAEESVGSTLPLGISGKAKRRFRTTLAGFALVAAFALALLFLAPWCGDHHDHDDVRSVTTTQSDKRPAAVPTGGTTTTTTAAPAHVVV